MFVFPLASRYIRTFVEYNKIKEDYGEKYTTKSGGNFYAVYYIVTAPPPLPSPSPFLRMHTV